MESWGLLSPLGIMAKLTNTSHEPLCKRNLICRRSFLLGKRFKALEYIRSDVFSLRKVTFLRRLQGLQGLQGLHYFPPCFSLTSPSDEWRWMWKRICSCVLLSSWLMEKLCLYLSSDMLVHNFIANEWRHKKRRSLTSYFRKLSEINTPECND